MKGSAAGTASEHRGTPVDPPGTARGYDPYATDGSGWRRRPGLLGGVVAVVVLALLGALLAVFWPAGSAPGGASSAPRRTSTGPAGPVVPATGAYVGAWSKPATFDDAGRRAAIDELERGVGRQLDIVHVYRLWDEPFPTSSDLDFLRRGYLLQLSWAGTDTRAIVSGQYDAMIRARAHAVRAAGKPLFMEWRWEMDRPNIADTVHSPADYVAAWKHIRTIFDQEGATNAAWVWCPTAAGFPAGRAAAYYPGDQWVDWVCVDAYPGPTWTPMSTLLAPFLSWAKDHPKPMMIGEYGVPRNRTPEQRAQWLRAAQATFQRNPQIKAVSYFDANPAGHSAPREYKLDDDPTALQAFSQLAQSPYFNPRHRPVT